MYNMCYNTQLNVTIKHKLDEFRELLHIYVCIHAYYTQKSIRAG